MNHCYTYGNECRLSPNLIMLRWYAAEQKEDSVLPVGPVQEQRRAPCSPGLVHLLDSTLKLGKTGSRTLPRGCQRAEREASWRERSHRTRWRPAGSSDVQPASEPIHYTFSPRSRTSHATLGFLPGAAPQNKWMVENLLPPPFSLLKRSQLPRLLKPRATEHTLCVLGAWLCHLAWSSRTRPAELAGVADSFKGLFILVLISEECKSLPKPTKGCCL